MTTMFDSTPMRPLRATVLALSFLATLSLAGAALARPPGGPPHGPGDPGGFLAEHADELGLDENTRDAIDKLLEDSRDTAEQQRRDLHAAREAMRELLESDEPQKQEVMQQAERIGALELAAAKHRLSTMLEILALLTPEQRARLVALREERRAERRERMRDRLDAGCRQALDESCPDAQAGPEMFSCLYEHRDALAPACSESLERLRNGRRGRGDHHGPGGWGGPGGPPPQPPEEF